MKVTKVPSVHGMDLTSLLSLKERLQVKDHLTTEQKVLWGHVMRRLDEIKRDRRAG